MGEAAKEHTPPEAIEGDAPILSEVAPDSRVESGVDVETVLDGIREASSEIKYVADGVLTRGALKQAEKETKLLQDKVVDLGWHEKSPFELIAGYTEALQELSEDLEGGVQQVRDTMSWVEDEIATIGKIRPRLVDKIRDSVTFLRKALKYTESLRDRNNFLVLSIENGVEMNSEGNISDDDKNDIITGARRMGASVGAILQQVSGLEGQFQNYAEETISKLNDMAEAARKETEIPSGETPVSVASQEVKGFNEERERELENLKETVAKILQTIQWLDAGAPFVGVQEAGLDTSDVRYSDLPKLVGESAIDWEDDIEAAAARAENDAREEAEQERLLDLLDEEEEQGREAIDLLLDAVEASHEGEPSPEVSAMVDAKTDALIEETGPGARSPEDTAQWWKDALAEQKAENAAKEAGELKSDEDIVEDAAAEAAKRHAERMEYFDEEDEEDEAEKAAAKKDAAAIEQGEAMEAFIAREDGTEAKEGGKKFELGDNPGIGDILGHLSDREAAGEKIVNSRGIEMSPSYVATGVTRTIAELRQNTGNYVNEDGALDSTKVNELLRFSGVTHAEDIKRKTWEAISGSEEFADLGKGEAEVDGADTEPEVTGGVETGDEDSDEDDVELEFDEDEEGADTESATEVDDADSEEADVGGDDSGAETDGETAPEDGAEEAEAAPEGEPLPQETQEQVVTAMEEEVLRDEPERTGWRKTVGWFAGRAAGLLTAGFTESFQADRFANATKEEAERLEDVMNSLEGLGPMAQEFRDSQNNNESLLDIYTRNSEIIGREVEQSVANLDAALLESKKMFKLFPVGPYRDQFSQKVMLMEKRVQDFKDRMLTQFHSEMQADAALTEHTVYQGIDANGEPYERPNEVLVTKKEFRGEMRKALDKTWWSRKVYSVAEKIPWLAGVKVLGGALLSTMSGSETVASSAAGAAEGIMTADVGLPQEVMRNLDGSIWNTVQQYAAEAGANLNNSQLVELSKQVALDNMVDVPVWDVASGAGAELHTQMQPRMIVLDAVDNYLKTI